MCNRIPPELSNKSYGQYKKELLAWKARGNEENIGLLVASSLPENGERDDIRRHVFYALSSEELASFDKVLSVLDRHLGMVEGLEIYEKYMYANLQRCPYEPLDNYISKFETVYTDILEPMKPQEIFVYKFLIGANLSKEDRKAVINGMNSDYENKGNLFELAKSSLKRFASKAVNIPVVMTEPQVQFGLLQPGPVKVPICNDNNKNTQQIEQTPLGQPQPVPVMPYGYQTSNPMNPPYGYPTSNLMNPPQFQQILHGQPNPVPVMPYGYQTSNPMNLPYGYPTSNQMFPEQSQQIQHGQPQPVPVMPYGYQTSNPMYLPYGYPTNNQCFLHNLSRCSMVNPNQYQ